METKVDARRKGSQAAGMVRFDGVQVFSATMAKDREQLGEKVTYWMQDHHDREVVDRVVTQSSDSEFHCLTITLFWRLKRSRLGRK